MTRNTTSGLFAWLALLGLLLSSCADDDDCMDNGRYRYCTDPADAVVHTEELRATMPVGEMSLADLYWETKLAGKRQTALSAGHRHALELAGQQLVGAEAQTKRAALERVRVEWIPQLLAAEARSNALSDELRRRCPGGASLNETTQSCGRPRDED
jgi:hypothetical protein